jgi:hypothetical protein
MHGATQCSFSVEDDVVEAVVSMWLHVANIPPPSSVLLPPFLEVLTLVRLSKFCRLCIAVGGHQRRLTDGEDHLVMILKHRVSMAFARSSVTHLCLLVWSGMPSRIEAAIMGRGTAELNYRTVAQKQKTRQVARRAIARGCSSSLIQTRSTVSAPDRLPIAPWLLPCRPGAENFFWRDREPRNRLPSH